MLDPKLFRTDLEYVVEQLAKRQYSFDKENYIELETKRKALQVKIQTTQALCNIVSGKIGKAKSNGISIDELMVESITLNSILDTSTILFNDIQLELKGLIESTPNILDESVPEGKLEESNVEIYKWGDIPEFNFIPKDHVELGSKFGMDFELGVKITSSRFCVLSGHMAKLQRALIQYMLDIHSNCGYEEVYVPFIVNADSLYCTGQLPKFEEDLFKTDNLYLIPTAEVPVTNIVRDTIIDAKDLPMKYVCHSPCFRSEAGSYGKDIKGLIRQHQFEKVELVQIVKPEDSEMAHEYLTEQAEYILQSLRLPYRKVLLCAGDTGFSSAKTYDLEVWLPSQNCYREISSCSNFKDFQSRRLQARWRNPETGKTELVHTINGSGLAVGRTLVAILENYQCEDGSIEIPEALFPYLKLSRI